MSNGTNPNYDYLRYALLPFVFSQPVTPCRANNGSKRVLKVEFPETLFTVPAGGEIEIIFMDGYVNGANSEPLAFFIQVNTTPTTTIQPRAHANKRALTNKPAQSEMGTSYVAGFIKLAGGSSGNLVTEYRFYEPVNFSTPTDYNNIYNVGTNAIRNAPNSGNSNRVNIVCLPVDLRYKRFLNLVSPDFHRMVTHIKVKNTSGSSTNLNIYGCWTVETTDSAYGGLTYGQDVKCPMKLAEYVFGNLRNTINVYSDNYLEANRTANIDSVITTALNEIIKTWSVLTMAKDSEIEEEDWSIQQRISNN